MPLPRMLDASLLRTGDVILSCSKDKASTWIAKFTKGRFSHASIYFKDYQIFEAITDGVGFSALEPLRVEMRNGQYRVLCSSSAFKDVALYRCPDSLRTAPGNDDYKLLPALQASFFSANGSEYRRGPGFANIVRLPRWIPSAVKQSLFKIAGQVALGDRRKILVEEYFCSELIVSTLPELGMPILKNQSLCPDEISPNDLANPALSFLTEVPNFFCYADTSAELAPDYVLMIRKMEAKAMSQKNIVKTTREFTQITKDIQTQMAKRMEERRKRE